MKQLDELELMLEKQRETIENQRRQVKKAATGIRLQTGVFFDGK